MEASALALVGLMGLVLLWLAHLNAMAQHGNDVNGCFNGVQPPFRLNSMAKFQIESNPNHSLTD